MWLMSHFYFVPHGSEYFLPVDILINFWVFLFDELKIRFTDATSKLMLGLNWKSKPPDSDIRRK